MKVARETVWTDKEGNLVSDGDPSAAILVASAGQEISKSAIEEYQNTAEAEFYFVDPSPVSTGDIPPLPDPADTVSKLGSSSLAKLRASLSGQFGIRLQSEGTGARGEQTRIIMETLDASPETPLLVTFDQFILDPFTGAGQFDLVERDSIRRVLDGASAGGTAVLTSATMNFQVGDVGKVIRIGRNPGRDYLISSRQSATQVTLSGNITLPSSGLTLTMEGGNEVEVATHEGFPDVDAVGNWSQLRKVITSDKIYSVVFVPGDAGDGIYSISMRPVYGGFIDPDQTPLPT